MTAAVLTWGLGLAQLMLVCAMGLAAWRIIHGPRAQDRVLGMDTLYPVSYTHLRAHET